MRIKNSREIDENEEIPVSVFLARLFYEDDMLDIYDGQASTERPTFLVYTADDQSHAKTSDSTRYWGVIS